jgi:hypothetical protein
MVCVTAVEEEAVTAVAKPPLTDAAHDSSRVGQTILCVNSERFCWRAFAALLCGTRHALGVFWRLSRTSCLLSCSEVGP